MLSLLQDKYLLKRWRDYSLRHFWLSMSAVFPSSVYSKGTHAPLMTRLPTTFRCGGKEQN